jgi:hypothetical protein
MNAVEIVFLFRGVERLLIEAGAIVCVVSGARLLKSPGLPAKPTKKAGSNEPAANAAPEDGTDFSAAGLGVNLKLDNAAPGSVLALFGMAIMGVALACPAKVNDLIPEASPDDKSAPIAGKLGNAVPPALAASGGAPHHAEAVERNGTEQASDGGTNAKTENSRRIGSSIQYAEKQAELSQFVTRVASANPADSAVALADFRAQAQALLSETPTGKVHDLLTHLSGWQASASESPDLALARFQKEARVASK